MAFLFPVVSLFGLRYYLFLYVSAEDLWEILHRALGMSCLCRSLLAGTLLWKFYLSLQLSRTTGLSLGFLLFSKNRKLPLGSELEQQWNSPCFPFLRDHTPVLPIVQCLKTSLSCIFVIFSHCLRWETPCYSIMAGSRCLT